MKIRPIPYGYIIQNGQHTVQTEQANAVKEIFRLYRNGYSYLAISAALNESSFPPYSADGWNKHQIKRMLENKRYMGDGQHPAIISDEEYNAVRTVHDNKTVSAASTDKSADWIWKHLVCAECGHKVQRTCCRSKDKMVWLRCDNPACRLRISLRLEDLHKFICLLMAQASEAVSSAYEPSLEVRKLERQIDRAMMKPDDPKEAVRLILQGIAIRYNTIPSPPDLSYMLNQCDDNGPAEPDWELFRKAVSSIRLSPTAVGIETSSGQEYFMERDDEYAGSGTASTGNNRNPRQSRA